jgi:hypothetical protein
MRSILATCVFVAALASPVLAQQGYVYQPSGLDFVGTAPVKAGETLTGLILQSTGFITLGDVLVQGQDKDDLFAYWVGTNRGNAYYYDSYSGYWKPGPMTYRRAKLSFQGETIEGWVRVFGNRLDYNHFFGQDGVLYNRVNVERHRTRKTNRQRKIIYTYFINMQTLERSDSANLPYIVIGSGSEDFYRQQMAQKEDQFRLILRDDPAFPNWQVEAFTPPSQVVIANGQATADELTLLQAAEQESGTLQVESQ